MNTKEVATKKLSRAEAAKRADQFFEYLCRYAIYDFKEDYQFDPKTGKSKITLLDEVPDSSRYQYFVHSTCTSILMWRWTAAFPKSDCYSLTTIAAAFFYASTLFHEDALCFKAFCEQLPPDVKIDRKLLCRRVGMFLMDRKISADISLKDAFVFQIKRGHQGDCEAVLRELQPQARVPEVEKSESKIETPKTFEEKLYDEAKAALSAAIDEVRYDVAVDKAVDKAADRAFKQAIRAAAAELEDEFWAFQREQQDRLLAVECWTTNANIGSCENPPDVELWHETVPQASPESNDLYCYESDVPVATVSPTLSGSGSMQITPSSQRTPASRMEYTPQSSSSVRL